jgi:hypothetical protein
MMRRPKRAVLFAGATCLLFFLLVGFAWAHVPRFTHGGIEPADAPAVQPPSKSWVFYGDVRGAGSVRYYRLDLEAGERLYVQSIVPREGRYPGLAVMGPELPSEGRLPGFLIVPPDAGAIVRPGTGDGNGGASAAAAGDDAATRGPGEAEYEPFTPGAYWHPAMVDISVPVSGSYYVAVYSEGISVPFGIAIGYEERYSVGEWVALPADLLTVYAWDGGWWTAFAPGIVTLLLGALLVAWRAVARWGSTGRTPAPSGWSALAAGLFCLATSATVLVQMLRAASRSGADPAMGVTAFFIVLPAVIGGLLLWLGWRATDPPGVFSRVGMFVLGLAALGLLAGYFAGPALAVLAAILPPYRPRKAAEAVPVGRVCVEQDGAGSATV